MASPNSGTVFLLKLCFGDLGTLKGDYLWVLCAANGTHNKSSLQQGDSHARCVLLDHHKLEQVIVEMVHLSFKGMVGLDFHLEDV